MSRTSPRGIALIKAHEGFRARRYYCPAGVVSIGHGHAMRPADDFPEPMTQAEAHALLIHDIAPIEVYLSSVLPWLQQGQFDALVSLIYNIGLCAFQRSTMLTKLLIGDIVGAADEFGRWIYANKLTLPGLVNRRRDERDLFLEEPT